MIDLRELAKRLQDAGLINKSFLECTKSEILQVVEAVFSSVGDDVPANGWSRPEVDGHGLRIPFDSHPKYHWWTLEGQSILETLIELEAPWEVAKRYLCSRHMTESDYRAKLLPF